MNHFDSDSDSETFFFVIFTSNKLTFYVNVFAEFCAMLNKNSQMNQMNHFDSDSELFSIFPLAIFLNN